MDSNANVADQVTSAKTKTTDFVKNKMFDVIAAAIVVAMLALSLGVLELRQISFKELANIVLETLPFYFATIMLNDNYYMKGTYGGKMTKSFKAIVTQYSAKVNALTGKQIAKLPDFCESYNTTTLVKMQTSLLRTEAITYEEFAVDYIEKVDGHEVSHGPLKALCKHELLSLLGSERAAVVIKAKKITIKGISTNILLGSSSNLDVTDLGPSEKEMHNKRKRGYAIGSFVAIFILTLVGVKNVVEWGWVGIMFVIFKLLYIVARSYMKYFEGYQDITISLANHISRKTDIIKEFESQYTDERINDLKET